MTKKIRDSFFWKALVLVVIGLFVGVSITPSLGSVSIKKQRSTDFVEIAESIVKDYDEIDNIEIDNFSLYSELNSYFEPGEFIVKFKEEINMVISEKTERTLQTGIRSLDELNKNYLVSSYEKIFNSTSDCTFSNIYRFNMKEDANVLIAIEEYSKNPYVEYAVPNYIFHYCNVPDDPYYSMQWPLDNIGQEYPWDGRFNNPPGIIDCDIDAPEAWDIETGSSDVVVAIVDSGVDYSHPDLAENIWINPDEDINNNEKFDNWPSWLKKNGVYGDIDKKDNDGNGFKDDVVGWDFSGHLDPEGIVINGSNDPMDNHGHGTHCAGIVAAVTNNNNGIAGISWNSKIMPIKAGKGGGLNLNGAVSGIKYAVDNGANIISMSWASLGLLPKLENIMSKLLKEVLDYAYINNVILVAAAGNFPIDRGVCNSYPACYDNVITVAATNSNDEIASFSSYGLPVDVAAPGVDILSLRAKNTDMYGNEVNIFNENYYIASGTSMACPHVSGIAALILSKKPDLTPMEIRTILRSSTDKMNSSDYAGIGRVNANKALQKAYPVIAKINSSLKVEEVIGSVKINGSAIGEGFQKYIVEYGKGVYPEVWVEIYNSTEKKENELLAIWDTSNLEEAVYTVRLKVICNQEIYEDRTMFLVNKICNTFFVDDDGGKDFIDIRSAINHAGNGDTIYVYNGTYNEDVYIYRSINLTGENKETTIINASNHECPIWIISGNGIKISGFTFLGKVTSVYLISSHNNSLFDNKIQDSTAGFAIVFSNENIIENNTIIKFTMGFLLEFSTRNIIQHNKIINNTLGIFFALAIGNKILRNEISNNTFGILLLESISNEIKYNNISKNKIVGILLRKTSIANQIQCNNFIKNLKSVNFKGCLKNNWNYNYWNRFRLLPKPIFGRVGRLGLIPWINFDWHPAKKPYEIL